MKKKFKDLKKGDTVWIIDSGAVVEASVKDTNQTYLYNQLRVYTSYCGFPYSGWPNSKRAGYMFVNEDEAYELLRKIGEKRKDILEKKIDNLVRKFDLLDSIQPPTVFSSTKPPSMKELKPGDSVWYVDKEELKIVEKKINKVKKRGIELINPPYRLKSSLEVFINSYESFYTFPRSYRSVRLLYYTTEEQAWRYMLKWKKSRMKTVGKEMEKLMKELERYEEVW
jgi:ribosomal protein S20